MEGALRAGQEQALQATTLAVAAALEDKPELLYPNPGRLQDADSSNTGLYRSLYAVPVDQPIIIDGYGDGWDDLEFQVFESSYSVNPLTIQYKAATWRGHLFLFLQITDNDVVFHNPALSREPNGDRLILRTWLDNRRQEFVIATAAPGKVTAHYKDIIYDRGSARQIRGQWQDTVRGYNLELEIPLSLTGGRLGFFVINGSSRAGGGFDTLGNAEPLDMAPPPWLIYTPDALNQAIAPFTRHDQRLQIVDKTHWLLADTATTAQSEEKGTQADKVEKTFWLVKALYRSILSRDTPLPRAPIPQKGRLNQEEITAVMSGAATSRWYKNVDAASRTLLSTAAPIRNNNQVIGAVLIRQSNEEYLSLTDKAFSRLLGYSLFALCVGVFGLLGYASLLSWRIQKLSRDAASIIRKDGSLGLGFPVSKAQDEIGELSRRYAQMLDKLREYNDYLHTLSRTLSHELRTPIAVIQTSLENLEHQQGSPEQNNTYLRRAKEGLARLNKILTAMSEANRLEESIHSNTPQRINLPPLLREVFSAYQGIYTNTTLTLDCSFEEAYVEAVPELFVQALDKLMDNAVSFCPEHGGILLALDRNAENIEISVSNEGPPLADELQHSLFDSMVSLRGGSSPGVHLGLGLYIVRLIAEFHRGSVRAENLTDDNGVVFTLTLPTSNAQASN
ncbi:MAG: two-component system sensor histidine kinase ChvG [Halioglobus sp.]|jgi:two-component system sensor histidine kinase ChvG